MFKIALTLTATLFATTSMAQESRPNILVIWGDDVGMYNISAYHRGLMGGSTPNIDRIASEGMLFLEQYAEASCTAGRAAFLTGQLPIRVGLGTVGVPGAPQGLSVEDPTIAEMLKPLGYATGQFGKNHLGDLDEHLPTNHGFDEFYGILYHLNAGEYVEQYDFPTDPAVAAQFAQRGIVHSFAMPDGTQTVEDLGNFGQERQRTLDEEVTGEAMRFIRDAAAADEPFFVWQNFTRMHYRTNLSEEYDGATGYGLYADGMKEMDDNVGDLLNLLDELGLAENTIVMYATDNGAASNSWPDGGNQPFRGEKGVGGYEGAYRVPSMIRWPGVVQPGSVNSEMIAMQDWMPTIMSALGQPVLTTDLLDGMTIGDREYRVHLDGYDQMPMLTGTGPSNRNIFYYFSETAFHGLRFGDFKFLFTEQDAWFNGVRNYITTPLITNLKLDPFERFHEARGFDEWQENRSWTIAPALGEVAKLVQSFEDYPPRSESFEIDVSAVGAQIAAFIHAAD